MTQPKVSIIIPVYNVENYLERCIDSLRNQTLKDIEIILVDDASPDSSGTLCDRFANEDQRIRVIHKQNEGAGMARNSALSVATGKYIGFVDSDDFVDTKMFETLYGKAEKYNSDLILSGFTFIDGNIFSRKGENISKIYFEDDTVFETEEQLKELRMGIVGSLPDNPDDSKYGMSIWKNLFRHEIIKENHLLFHSEREIFSEDAMFMMDFIAHISKAVGIPEAFYNYCRNGDSVSKSYKSDRFEKGLAFIAEVEKNFKNGIKPQEYQAYTDRFWQAFCRVLCSQEIMHANDNKTKYKELTARLKMFCTHPITKAALSRYPIAKLPLMQFVFAWAMKHRLYFLLKILVDLRNR